MAYYAVTFRIADKTIGNATYTERRQRLIDNVMAGMGYWEETTSFFLVESPLDTLSFGQKAVGGLSARDDMVVIFDIGDQSGCYFGPVKHADVLTSFLPLAKKLP